MTDNQFSHGNSLRSSQMLAHRLRVGALRFTYRFSGCNTVSEERTAANAARIAGRAKPE